jgi:hypothetical protein
MMSSRCMAASPVTIATAMATTTGSVLKNDGRRRGGLVRPEPDPGCLSGIVVNQK